MHGGTFYRHTEYGNPISDGNELIDFPEKEIRSKLGSRLEHMDVLSEVAKKNML